MFWAGIVGLMVYPLWAKRQWIAARVLPSQFILAGILIAALGLVVVAVGLIWQGNGGTRIARQSAEFAIQKYSDFEWGFERHRGYYFVGMSSKDGAIVIHQFQAQGRNNTADPIKKVKAYVRSDRTNKEYPVLFNLRGSFAAPDEINPIPVGAIIDTRAYFSPDNPRRPRCAGGT